jgi:hypothetical protein
MHQELADLEKKEALFLNGLSEDITNATAKIKWKATSEGQRMIELKHYILPLNKILDSLKSRIYTFI